MANTEIYKRVTLRMTKKQYSHLLKQTQAAGIKMEPYMRSLIMGHEVRPRPPDEYIALLREMSAIGNNLNQLVRIVNANKKASHPQLEECRKMFSEMFKLVKGSL